MSATFSCLWWCCWKKNLQGSLYCLVWFVSLSLLFSLPVHLLVDPRPSHESSFFLFSCSSSCETPPTLLLFYDDGGASWSNLPLLSSLLTIYGELLSLSKSIRLRISTSPTFVRLEGTTCYSLKVYWSASPRPVRRAFTTRSLYSMVEWFWCMFSSSAVASIASCTSPVSSLFFSGITTHHAWRGKKPFAFHRLLNVATFSLHTRPINLHFSLLGRQCFLSILIVVRNRKIAIL